MTKSKTNRPFGNYWVQINGYDQKYAPLYYGQDGWRIEICDTTRFISDHQLERLFGKECVDRQINPATDVVSCNQNEDNVFSYALTKDTSGGDMICHYNESTQSFYYHNRFSILEKSQVVGYLVHPSEQVSDDVNELSLA